MLIKNKIRSQKAKRRKWKTHKFINKLKLNKMDK